VESKLKKQPLSSSDLIGVKKDSYVPTRSVKPLTVIKEFNFSKKRVYSGVQPSSSQQPKVVRFYTARTGFAEVLIFSFDQVIASSVKRPLGLTKPRPFHFHTSSKRASTLADHSPYVPLAERLKDFEKTPDRFKRGIRKVRMTMGATVR
jgi:hypothetical protein